MITPKKILLFVLMICTLGYSSAWAYDNHVIIIDTDPVITVNISAPSLNDQTSEQQVAAKVTCDHCCHISAHLQAIFTQNDNYCGLHQAEQLGEFSQTSFSFVISPNLRPPRV